MATDLSIRSVEPRDLPAILELLRTSLGEGRTPRTEEYWRWKHEQNPFGRSPAFVAVDAGQIVGLRVFLRWRWRRGRKEYEAVRAVDTATHPEYRGRGIFTRLTLALAESVAKEGASFVFNTPNKRSRGGYLKMGWSDVGRVSLWVRPLRPLRMVGAVSRRNRQDGSLRKEPVHPESNGPGRAAGEVLTDPKLLQLLGGLSLDSSRFRTSADARYLLWRYALVPGFEYRADYRVRNGDGAAVVYQVQQRNGLRELRICDLFVPDTPGSTREGRDLLRRLVHESDADYAVAVGAPNTPEQAALRAARFIPAPRLGPTLTVRPLNGDHSATDRASWRLSIGDLELF